MTTLVKTNLTSVRVVGLPCGYMAFSLQARRREDEIRTRILLSSDVANTFRKLCRYKKKSLDDMLEELMKQYIKTSAPELKMRRRP